MVRAFSILGVLLLAVGAARAQGVPPTDQAEQMKLLLERIQQLERRVNELEAKQGPPVQNAVYTASESATPANPRIW